MFLWQGATEARTFFRGKKNLVPEVLLAPEKV
jgi:hypothetical protein